MHTQTRSTRWLSCFIALAPFAIAIAPAFGCAAPTSVAVNPISGRVYSTMGKTLWSCDAAGENCTQGAVVIEPEDTAVLPDSRVVFTAGASIYVCNDEGQACIEVKLPASMRAAGLAVGPSGQIVVVGTKGALATCTETECRAVPDASAKPSTNE